jgi:hypothetical protein
MEFSIQADLANFCDEQVLCIFEAVDLPNAEGMLRAANGNDISRAA